MKNSFKLIRTLLSTKSILALEAYKSIMQFNPEFLWHCFNTNPIPYNLRKGSRLLIPSAKSVNFGANSVTFRGSLLWNNLPLRLKNSQTIDDFKSELKNWKSTALALCVASDWLFLHSYSLWVFRWLFSVFLFNLS